MFKGLNLNGVDFAIMAVAVVALRLVSLSTRHYMKGVSDFLSANRVAGRYMLTISGAMGNTGVISIVAGLQVYWTAGLAWGWWGNFGIPLGLIMLLTGWVYYRFRETRAMTMAQFLEMRYSRRLRILAGILCWTSGILNFGIFPAVAARFFIYFCGFRDSIPIHFGLYAFDLPTIAIVMGIDLILALSFVTMGGQISVMVTECVQGMFCSFAFIIVAVAIFLKIHWSQMMAALAVTSTANASMFNPFHTSGIKDYNIWYYLIGVCSALYGQMSWQGAQGFYSAARNPHEQKMGGIIGMWRGFPQSLAMIAFALGGLAVLRLPEFATQAHAASLALSHIQNPDIQSQMRVPIAMAHVLPWGIRGLLATTFLFFSFTCHDTYMHSWGSIFVQDIYMPIRNKALDPALHVKYLRWSIIFVAIFAFAFSLWYKPTEDILFFFAITGTIWLGGSGAVIVGGLYWKKGTTAAAYTALIAGAVMGMGGLILTHYYKLATGNAFPINNQYLYAMTMGIAALSYVIVSLVQTRRVGDYNLERMLHRGRYRIATDHVEHESVRSRLSQMVGITREFSKWDAVLAIVMVTWNMGSFLWFLIFTVANLFFPISDLAWQRYYFVVMVAIPGVLALPGTIWFTTGGIMDIKAMFKILATVKRDHTDDGRVVGYHDEEPELLEPGTIGMLDASLDTDELRPMAEETEGELEK